MSSAGSILPLAGYYRSGIRAKSLSVGDYSYRVSDCSSKFLIDLMLIFDLITFEDDVCDSDMIWYDMTWFDVI